MEFNIFIPKRTVDPPCGQMNPMFHFKGAEVYEAFLRMARDPQAARGSLHLPAHFKDSKGQIRSFVEFRPQDSRAGSFFYGVSVNTTISGRTESVIPTDKYRRLLSSI